MATSLRFRYRRFMEVDVNLDAINQHETIMAWLSSDEALKILNVRAQTLYANVSRGKIRAKRDTKDPRRSVYYRDDVMRLANRPQGRRKVEAVSADAIEWGDPVLPSAISTVADGQLWYRGHNAVELAAHASLEEVAALLWESDAVHIDADAAPLADTAAFSSREATGSLSAGLLALAARCAGDLPTYGRATALLQREAADVLATLAHAMLGREPRERGRKLRVQRSLSARIAATWNRPAHEDVIRRALVLLADHELNASTFATRVAISTGASLSAGVLAGLTALTGPLHGGASASVMTLIASSVQIGSDTAVRESLAHGRPFPAFGHPLYPDGDPRAKALLEEIDVPEEFSELAAAVERLVGERPNVDFALAALSVACRLPAEAALTLFALGRCVGWLAHALEQAANGRLIRPRARYVGVALNGANGPQQ
jgi:citrate synthase